MTDREYRAMVTALRARIGLVERSLTKKQPEKVNYEAVPAQAMLKYRQAFERNDKDRFAFYLAEVEEGEKRIHSDTLFPYEVLRPFFSGSWRHSANPKGTDTLEQLWNHLPGEIGSANAISVVDTSGSMYCARGPLTPALISQAMGLYCAERCQGVFHNVNSWQMQAPVTAHTKGAALQSGASTHALKEKFDGNITPMDHMLRVLNGERYRMIHA